MSFIVHLEALEDTRKNINKTYELTDIIFLTMSAVLSGAQGWKDIQIFGESKLEWLRQFRPLTSGIPTRHSIGRIIRGISAPALMASFAQWVNQQREEIAAYFHKIRRDDKTLFDSNHYKDVDGEHGRKGIQSITR